jgi:hypothetical protein
VDDVDVTAQVDSLLNDPRRVKRGGGADWVDPASPRCGEAVELVNEVLALGKRLGVTEVELNGLLGLPGTGKVISRVKRGGIKRQELEPLTVKAGKLKEDFEKRLAG